jgi:hypothetical protein
MGGGAQTMVMQFTPPWLRSQALTASRFQGLDVLGSLRHVKKVDRLTYLRISSI